MQAILVFEAADQDVVDGGGARETEGVVDGLALLLGVLCFEPLLVTDGQRKTEARADVVAPLSARVRVITPADSVDGSAGIEVVEATAAPIPRAAEE